MNNSVGVFIFWLFTSACLGAFIGGMIERQLGKRSNPPTPSFSSDNQLSKVGDIEILRAWRTSAGKIWLEMDRTRLEDNVSLQAEQRRRLLNLVLDLRPWLETIPGAEPKAEGQPILVTPAPPVPPPAQPEKRQEKPADGSVKPAIILKSIIEQIDDVLQVKLAATVYKDRGIQLVEGPGGFVIVKDGLNRYEGVDSVPDPEIKALIKQAVAEWEKTTR